MRRAILLGIVMLLVAGLALARTMPRLPADRTLPQTGDSPGKVVFSHQNHVGFQAKADCTACHPKLAPILHGARRTVITHEKMLKGEVCGACHGKTAHGFDDCGSCHK